MPRMRVTIFQLLQRRKVPPFQRILQALPRVTVVVHRKAVVFQLVGQRDALRRALHLPMRVPVTILQSAPTLGRTRPIQRLVCCGAEPQRYLLP